MITSHHKNHITFASAVCVSTFRLKDTVRVVANVCIEKDNGSKVCVRNIP
jgi:hypothetical protein